MGCETWKEEEVSLKRTALWEIPMSHPCFFRVFADRLPRASECEWMEDVERRGEPKTGGENNEVASEEAPA